MSTRLFPLIASLSLFLLTSASPLKAAPSASLTTSADRRFAYLTFSDLRTVSKVDYTLTYDTQNRNTGLAGGFKTNRFTSKSSRRQILGTCSTRFCTYHKNPKNVTLQVTFTLRSGAKSTLTKTLP
jgi:hypothetical protein